MAKKKKENCPHYLSSLNITDRDKNPKIQCIECGTNWDTEKDNCGGLLVAIIDNMDLLKQEMDNFRRELDRMFYPNEYH